MSLRNKWRAIIWLKSKVFWAVSLLVTGGIIYIGEFIVKVSLLDDKIYMPILRFFELIPAWVYVALISFGIGMLIGIFWERFLFTGKKYQDSWSHLEFFYPWQAACLIAGEEPYLAITPGSKPYPYLKKLNEAAEQGRIPFTPETSRRLYNFHARFHKDHLRKYLKENSIVSKFPF